MANLNVLAITKNGDEINAVEFWLGATSATILEASQRKQVSANTLNGGSTPIEFWAGATAASILEARLGKQVSANTLNGGSVPIEFWLGVNAATIPFAVASKNIRAQSDVFDPIAGYIFPISPATLQPQLPRATQFPYAP